MLPTGCCTGWDSSQTCWQETFGWAEGCSASAQTLLLLQLRPEPLVTFPTLGATRLLLSTALALHRDPRGTGLYGPSIQGAGAAPAALEQVLTHLSSPFSVDREYPWALLSFANPLLSTPSTACLSPRAAKLCPCAELPSDTHSRLPQIFLMG